MKNVYSNSIYHRGFTCPKPTMETPKHCKICPKLTMKSTYKNKTIKVLLLSLLLNLNRFHTLPWCFHCPGVSIAEVNAGWDGLWGAIFECFA